MPAQFRLHLTVAALTAILVGAGNTLAQHQHHDTTQPKHHHSEQTNKQDGQVAKAGQRVGDPYPFGTCPITGKKLGSMGDPVVKLYDGREVRFCCPACPEKFEKDKTANLGKLDEKIIKGQAPLYPLKTSAVTGRELPEKPYEFVYGNRLVRVGAESEKAEFLKDPKKYLGELDKAVIADQGRHYVLAKCPVSGEEYGGDMGEPKDVVVAGRLIRLCCADCKRDLESDPAKYIAKVDAARKGEKDHTPHQGHGHKKPHGGG